jgi:hypothetical protein
MAPETDKRSALLVLLLLGLATALKALWALHSGGTCDPILFFTFARELQHVPLPYLYQNSGLFNHTPLTACFIKELYVAVNGQYGLFAAALRLLCIGADLAVVLALLQRRQTRGTPAWWALAAFAASPVSIMVSGFHGNLDPVMIALVVFAVLALEKEKPLLCGLLLGLACNIKIVPLLLGPLFFAWWLARGRRAVLTFSLAALAPLVAGFGWALWQYPPEFRQHVFGYGSYWGTWGLSWWLRATGIAAFQKVDFAELDPAQNLVMQILKDLTIGGVLLLAWRRRLRPASEFFGTLAAAFTLILVFAPGAGPQYLVWGAPFLLIESAGWWAATTVGATLFMVAFYQASANSPFPWDIVFPKGPELARWGPWTNCAWLPLVALLCYKGRGWFDFAGTRAEAIPAPPPAGALEH